MVKNQKGFTLVEMLIVLLIISVLIIITIPNVTKHFASIDEKGCDAFVNMVQGQVEAFKIEKHTYPTDVAELVSAEYLNGEETKCPNGQAIVIEGGKVKAVNSENQLEGQSDFGSDGTDGGNV